MNIEIKLTITPEMRRHGENMNNVAERVLAKINLCVVQGEVQELVTDGVVCGTYVVD